MANLDSKALQARVSPTEVRVFEPHEKRERRYRALPLRALWTSTYGRLPAPEQAVRFTCKDGYAPIIPADELLNHPCYLAVASADNAPFTVDYDGRVRALGPYYLIWGNLQDSKLDKWDANDWPYQIVAIELVESGQALARLYPPKGSSEPVRRGFLAFRHNCLACHSLNHEGGKSAPDLNFPVSATERHSEEWLRRFVDNPASLHPHTAMPKMRIVPHRDQDIADIVAYLKAMSKPGQHR